ncbi:MAG: OmpA family protein [Granulosicoccaceae bacterium]
MQKGILASALSAAFLVGCAGMNGASSTACDAALDAQDGYYSTPGKNVLISGGKGIVRAANWSEDKAAACEGGSDADAEAAAAAAAAKAAEEAAAKAAAEAAAAAAAAESAEKVPVNKPIKLDARALFATNSAELSGSGISAIDQLAQGISELSEVNRVVVVGHTDSRGAEAYNQALSEKRAQSVRDQLSAKLPNLDIAAIGRGETRPVASNDTALGRAKNRRVEIVVIGTKQEMQ